MCVCVWVGGCAFAENRERFAHAATAKPENFSELQMAAYLKTSQFKQQIEKHKMALGGNDPAMVSAYYATVHVKHTVDRLDTWTLTLQHTACALQHS